MTSMFNTDYAEIKITQTMLDKHIIDANKSVIKLFERTYDTLTNGDGIAFRSEYFNEEVISVIRCYKAKTRGDKRISISGLKKYAQAGDVIGIFKRLNEEQYHNRPDWSVVKLSDWGEDQMDDLKSALVDDGLVKSNEPD